MATSSEPTTTSEMLGSLSITNNDLSDLIKIQGDLVRKLKAEKVSAERVCYLIIS
jgi:hypothetical protein